MNAFIPVKVHAILDYCFGFIFLVCPAVFGFYDIETARKTFFALGSLLIAYSLFTQYDFSLFKVIPFRLHLWLDASIGLAALIAPWIFQYQGSLTDMQLILHFALGMSILALVVFTAPQRQIQAQFKEDLYRKAA